MDSAGFVRLAVASYANMLMAIPSLCDSSVLLYLTFLPVWRNKGMYNIVPLKDHVIFYQFLSYAPIFQLISNH
jgi:hypothetical protein